MKTTTITFLLAGLVMTEVQLQNVHGASTFSLSKLSNTVSGFLPGHAAAAAGPSVADKLKADNMVAAIPSPLESVGRDGRAPAVAENKGVAAAAAASSIQTRGLKGKATEKKLKKKKGPKQTQAQAQ